VPQSDNAGADSPSKRALLQYFRGHVDLLNAVALLRVRQMKKDESFFMSVLLSGGTIRAQSCCTARKYAAARSGQI